MFLRFTAFSLKPQLDLRSEYVHVSFDISEKPRVDGMVEDCVFVARKELEVMVAYVPAKPAVYCRCAVKVDVEWSGMRA